MASLSTKYRPKEFNEVSSQRYVIKILERQLELKQFNNCYLFCGSSGVGKTTIARIFANKINNNKGTPIEIDGASNNGVDNVRAIISNAKERSLDSEYKVFIIDEAHQISIAGWNAFLKCIEEPPKYTIFMFCTTEPQKVPNTIQNRTMRLNLSKVNREEIKDRLLYICKQEDFSNYQETCDYVSKLCEGCMRLGISMIEKCAGYATDLSIDNALKVLGNFSYNTFFDLTNAIIDQNNNVIISTIDKYFNDGDDLSLFISQYLDFIFDLTKYSIFKNINVTKIPESFEKVPNTSRCVSYVTQIYEKEEDNVKFYSYLSDKILEIKNTIKYDSNIRTTIEIMLMNIAREQNQCLVKKN